MKFMKLLIIASLLGFSTASLAQLSPQQQQVLLEAIAKQERRALWQKGLQDVESSIEKMNKDELSAVIEETNQGSNAEKFSPADLRELQRCARQQKCELFRLEIYVNEMGGTGILHAWVMLQTSSGQYDIIRRWVFEE